MRKVLSILLLALLCLLIPLGAVLASYEYYIPIEVSNTNTTAFEGLPILTTLNNDQLADLGYIGSSGLDTELREGAASRFHSVSDARLGLFIPSIDGTQTRTYNYRLGLDPAQSSFSVITGVGGYTTISDQASLELGGDFKIEFDGYLDVSVPDRFPVVQTTATSEETSTTNTHTVSLPSGIQAGDVLIFVFFGNAPSGNPSMSSWPPSGWTSLTSKDDNNVDDCYAVAYKVASGSEGSTVTVETSGFPGNCFSLHQSYRLSSCMGDVELTDTSQFDDDATPDPPSESVSWGTDYDTLWLAGFVGAEVATRTISSYPTNYDNEYFQTGEDHSHVATARRELTAASEDPGVYTLSDIVDGWAFTIGIQGFYNTQSFLKEGVVEFDNTASGEITATVTTTGGDLTLIATGLSSEIQKVELYTNSGTIYLDIEDVNQDTTVLTPETVVDNSNDWIIVVPYFDYYQHTVSSSLKAWYEPVTMILSDTLTDRSGSANHGAITWGSNPEDITVTIGGVLPYSAYVPPGEEDEDVPDVIPVPDEIVMDNTQGATGMGLPFYSRVKDGADSMGWTVPTMYSIWFIIIAVVLGIGGLVAMGSIWGFVAMFGATSAMLGSIQDSGGYNVMPMFITIFCVLFAVFVGYIWRYT